MGKKSAKGTVKVDVFRDRLRLIWSYLGNRYFLYIGLPDTKTNRTVAEGKARIIEGDIATGNFDSSLKKYQLNSKKSDRLLVTELFEKFTLYKTTTKDQRQRISSRTLEKYKAIQKHLTEYFKSRAITNFHKREAEQFTDWMLERLKPVTARDRVAVLSACWKWAIQTGLTSENPWTDIKITVIKKPPKPFNTQEIQKIVNGFRVSRAFSYYTDFVEFTLSTAARTGEVIGLCWKHLNEDCSVVHLQEQLTRGERKDIKNHKERAIKLSPRIQKMLLERKHQGGHSENLVFPAPKGGAIDDHNFQRRIWEKVLNSVGVEYRKPYNMRHTALSHSLAQGNSPAKVAELAGDRVETILRTYIGNVEGLPEAIDFIE